MPYIYACACVCVLNFLPQACTGFAESYKQGNNYQPSYICESDETAKVYSTPTVAINETYKKLFNTQMRYSGSLVMDFDDETIAEEL